MNQEHEKFMPDDYFWYITPKPVKAKEQIIRELASRISTDTFQYEIDDYLKSEGVDTADYEEISVKARELASKKSRIIRKTIWWTLALLTFITFYALIPVGTYNNFPFFLSFLGGGLLAVFVIQALADFRSIEDFQEFNKKSADNTEPDKQRKYSYYGIAPGIVCIFVFVVHFSNREEAALKNDGIKVTGVVVDGESKKSRRSTSYEVVIRYRTLEGVERTARESVSASEFNSFYQGMPVELIYSKKDPGMIELLTDPSSIQTYTNSQERDLLPEDLIRLLDVKGESLGDTLNHICYGWTYNKADKIWVNERKKIALARLADNQIRYMSFSVYSIRDFPDGFEALGFVKIQNPDSASSVKIYNSEKFAATITLKSEGVSFSMLTEVIKK